MPALLLSVRFRDGRYHGRPDWPPSPARLFQALVAGVARGRTLDDADKRAFAWLEAQAEAPLIAAPHHRPGQGFSNYVPNNDLDAVGGDPKRVDKIRAPKLIKPILFDTETPLLYLWRFSESAVARDEAQRICAIAERLYQLGRGVDMAWATGEILSEADAEARLADYPGAIHNPSGGGGVVLAVPIKGSLESLIARHTHRRFEHVRSNKKQAQLFRQPPKTLFRQIAYDSPPARLLFDLIGDQTPAPLARIAPLTEQIRDLAAKKLSDKLPARAGEIERCLIGRGADEADKARRVRITPLPSIGHPKASPAIRRVLVEVPAGCPRHADDLAWAFSGLELVAAAIDPESGEVKEQLTLTAASDFGMLRHYGLGERATVSTLWRTVTPAALSTSRRRIAPERRREEAKAGGERAREERDAIQEVRAALRHAGARARVESVRVQREPFSAKGERAERFAHGRFAKERLWHVEIAFAEPQHGPLLLGDGRYLGLGLMAPVEHVQGVFAFEIVSGLAASIDHSIPTRALRRAIMARAAQLVGPAKPLPIFFSGHEPNGSPARSEHHRHLAYALDPSSARLLVVAPHLLERRSPTKAERGHIALLEEALRGFCELRAGEAGVLRLRPISAIEASHTLFAPSSVWESATPFRVVRHPKVGDARAALEQSLTAEIRRLGLPAPQVTVLGHEAASGVGLSGRARLTFPVAVEGLLLVGRDRHFGGGLFRHAQP